MSYVDSITPAPVMEGATAPQPEYRYDIEGLRGVTLLAILGFHAEVPGVGGGFVGPDIFFIISGFVITGQLWKEIAANGTLATRRFYGGRARRLLPVAALVGVVTTICSVILLPPLQIRSVIGDGIACALYVGNYRFALQGVDYFASDRAPSPFQHYWTLGVEEQFYLLWPIMLIATAWILRRARRRRGSHRGAADPSKTPYLVLLGLIAVASFAFSLWATQAMPPMAYFSLPSRAFDLAAGCLLALTANQWRRLPPLPAAILGWAGLTLILLVCNQFRSTVPYPGTAALLPLLGTVLVLGAGCAKTTHGCGLVLAWVPMRAIGRLSYSWYLWHWPILLFIPILLDRPMGLADRLASVAISGGLAMLTLHAVENPLRYATSLRRSPLRSLAVGAIATATAVSVGLALLLWVPPPVGHSRARELTIDAGPPVTAGTAEEYEAAVQRAVAQVQEALTASADLHDVPSNLTPPLTGSIAEAQRLFFGGCLRNYLEVGQAECAMGDATSSTTVALIGDSNAAMWTPAFQQVASQRHWRLEMLAKGLCPVLDLPTLIYGRAYTECDQWRTEILTRLAREHPKLVVFSIFRRFGHEQPEPFNSYDPAWIDSLTKLVRRLRGTGAQVLVLGPIPDPQSPPTDCLSRHLDDAPLCFPPKSLAVNESGIAAETAAVTSGGGQYADVTALFCAADICPVIVGNTLVYFDRKHVTLEYSQQLGPVLGAFADRALAHG